MALHAPEGRIVISWEVLNGPDGPEFHFDWAESDGPAVEPPSRAGFGSRIIKENLRAEFSGNVNLDFLPSGLHRRLTAPWLPV
jgi:two-component sensor histidine kinase